MNIYISNEHGENPRQIEGVRQIEVTRETERMHEEDTMNMFIAQAAEELGEEGNRRMRVRMSDEIIEHMDREDGLRQLERTIERQMALLSGRMVEEASYRPYEVQRGRQIYKSWNRGETENILKGAKAKLPPTNNREAVKLLDQRN